MGEPRSRRLVHKLRHVCGPDELLRLLKERIHRILRQVLRLGRQSQQIQQRIHCRPRRPDQMLDRGDDVFGRTLHERLPLNALARAAHQRVQVLVCGPHGEHNLTTKERRHGDVVDGAVRVRTQAERLLWGRRVVAPHRVQNLRPMRPPCDSHLVRLQGHQSLHILHPQLGTAGLSVCNVESGKHRFWARIRHDQACPRLYNPLSLVHRQGKGNVGNEHCRTLRRKPLLVNRHPVL
mmetsp:Transcript_54364/g.96658  ORF Transcript_54364/g.96658 Transcript_54364/m.96658 type:complete len:236 (-) Transcript_54364:994-1701(-)